MKCPDCGGRLTELRMEGGDIAHRCGRCGGFFMDGWTINRLTAKQIELWRRISIGTQWVSGGSGMCPMDGTMLSRYSGEAVPQSIPSLRCVRCGKWWFPRDTLFDFKPAQEAKVNYFRMWGITADLAGMVLPILMIVVLLGGLGVGVGLVRRGQRVAIEAQEIVRDLSITQTGTGEVQIRFKSRQAVRIIEVKKINGLRFTDYELSFEDGEYVARIEGLEVGEYVVRILGKEYGFKIIDL